MTVVNELVSSGAARDLGVARTASNRSSPESRRLRMSSAITTPLSTRRPNATMIAAIDTRCSSIPHTDMPISVAIIVKGTIEPTIRPVRTPKNTITTASTTATVCIRLMVALLTDACTRSGWKITTFKSIPNGNFLRISNNFAFTCWPSSTTFDFFTIDTPKTIACCPL